MKVAGESCAYVMEKVAKRDITVITYGLRKHKSVVEQMGRLRAHHRHGAAPVDAAVDAAVGKQVRLMLPDNIAILRCGARRWYATVFQVRYGEEKRHAVIDQRGGGKDGVVVVEQEWLLNQLSVATNTDRSDAILALGSMCPLTLTRRRRSAGS